MLVQLGHRAPDLDVADLLVDCHRKIRYFLDLAHKLATSPTPPTDDIREAAARVHRYFAIAFPLHLIDEEASILPRLRGRDPALDRALAQVAADHADHAQLVATLANLCALIAGQPWQLAARTTALGDLVDRLTLILEAHLSLEELVVFPALTLLTAAERAAIRTEMRARRDVALRLN